MELDTRRLKHTIAAPRCRYRGAATGQIQFTVLLMTISPFVETGWNVRQIECAGSFAFHFSARLASLPVL
jgi:hypothetical protein